MSNSVLATVVKMVLQGTQAIDLTDNNELSPFISKCSELSVQHGCLMRGMRVVVPLKLQKRVLEELHTGHPGIVRIKAIARSYVWWQGFDADIELQVQMCQVCQQPLHPCEWPSKPCEHIHVDWPEVQVMTSTTTERNIDVLRNIFSHYGLPKSL